MFSTVESVVHFPTRVLPDGHNGPDVTLAETKRFGDIVYVSVSKGTALLEHAD